ncbi:UDP-N-acetylglucosamine 2-epimerase [Fontivita pretiosa]|uniref:UDP-N-acetylglucosamine 2-epimerase n=1 Tax=Fontivita pretiosa TaxID=2989684 RepID=UPI003D185C1F
MHRTRVCYVTGSRAEFGLMDRTLKAIARHPRLRLQIIVTGMHLDRRRGRSIDELQRQGWTIDAVVPWRQSPQQSSVAAAMGRAIAGIARALDRLGSDVVLVVGDRVEAFAAAAAGHVGGRIVAHVHGGDRAPGIVDDSLRHAITKLAHIHFPATRQSAARILRLGEDPRRVHVVGSPGIEAIREDARADHHLRPRRFALLVLHPAQADQALEAIRAELVLDCVTRIGFDRVVIVYPNNDPGSQGIARVWDRHARDPRLVLHRNLPRASFLGLLRDAAVLVGNSSSGIIEAGSFGTPVVDIGPRQKGRLRNRNVVHVPYSRSAILAALRKIWNDGRPMRFRRDNLYGGGATGDRIARVLAGTGPETRAELRQKLIMY